MARAGEQLIFFEIKVVASDAEVFDDVGDDAVRHIAGMSGKGDEPVGPEQIGVVPVAARRAEQLAADFQEPPPKLAAVAGRVPAPDSGGKGEFAAERRGHGTASFQ